MRNGLIVDENGNKFWYKDNLLHREDGPATEYTNMYKAWWINGKRHREDGPAIESYNGSKRWWLNGKYIDCSSQEEFLRIIKLKSFL